MTVPPLPPLLQELEIDLQRYSHKTDHGAVNTICLHSLPGGGLFRKFTYKGRHLVRRHIRVLDFSQCPAPAPAEQSAFHWMGTHQPPVAAGSCAHADSSKGRGVDLHLDTDWTEVRGLPRLLAALAPRLRSANLSLCLSPDLETNMGALSTLTRLTDLTFSVEAPRRPYKGEGEDEGLWFRRMAPPESRMDLGALLLPGSLRLLQLSFFSCSAHNTEGKLEVFFPASSPMFTLPLLSSLSIQWRGQGAVAGKVPFPLAGLEQLAARGALRAVEVRGFENDEEVRGRWAELQGAVPGGGAGGQGGAGAGGV
jgi:hypothetical protein